MPGGSIYGGGCLPASSGTTDNGDVAKLRDFTQRITDTLNTLAKDKKKADAQARLTLISSEVQLVIQKHAAAARK